MKKYTFNGYELTLRATGKRDEMNKEIVSYKLAAPTGETIFKGRDFHVSPLHDAEGRASAGALLAFLTLREGDTDADYFENYTPRQIDFRDNEAENLYNWREELEAAK